MADLGVPEAAVPTLLRGGFPEVFRSSVVPAGEDVLRAPVFFFPEGGTNGSLFDLLPAFRGGAAAFLAVLLVPAALFRRSLLDLVLLDVPLVALADTVTLPLEFLVGTPLAPFATDLATFFFELTLAAGFTAPFAAALERATAGALVAVVAGLGGVAAPFLAVERPFAGALFAPDFVRWDAFLRPMAFFATVRFAAFRAPFVAGIRLVAMVVIGQVPR